MGYEAPILSGVGFGEGFRKRLLNSSRGTDGSTHMDNARVHTASRPYIEVLGTQSGVRLRVSEAAVWRGSALGSVCLFVQAVVKLTVGGIHVLLTERAVLSADAGLRLLAGIVSRVLPLASQCNALTSKVAQLFQPGVLWFCCKIYGCLQG